MGSKTVTKSWLYCNKKLWKEQKNRVLHRWRVLRQQKILHVDKDKDKTQVELLIQNLRCAFHSVANNINNVEYKITFSNSILLRAYVILLNFSKWWVAGISNKIFTISNNKCSANSVTFWTVYFGGVAVDLRIVNDQFWTRVMSYVLCLWKSEVNEGRETFSLFVFLRQRGFRVVFSNKILVTDHLTFSLAYTPKSFECSIYSPQLFSTDIEKSALNRPCSEQTPAKHERGHPQMIIFIFFMDTYSRNI